MAVICRQLGFKGDYTIIDLPEFSLLQEYYLSNTGYADKIQFGPVFSVEGFWEFFDKLHLGIISRAGGAGGAPGVNPQRIVERSYRQQVAGHDQHGSKRAKHTRHGELHVGNTGSEFPVSSPAACLASRMRRNARFEG